MSPDEKTPFKPANGFHPFGAAASPGHMLGQGEPAHKRRPVSQYRRPQETPAPPDAHWVLCPLCHEPAYLEALQRSGAYRLMHPDGGSHATVCGPLLERKERTVLTYHPHQPAARRGSAA